LTFACRLDATPQSDYLNRLMGDYLTWQNAKERRAMWQEQAKTVVFTNGHFDLLHIGHLDYLEKARALGDVLIVGINGDDASRHLKGTGRPITPALERARLVAALVPVTATVIFNEDTAINLITALQPDIYVKGGDYAHKPLPERATVESYGGVVRLIDYLPDHSTTNIITKIQALPKE
jgi:rfaE bifunctional protein nucleotidyltransferase chain/domain